MNIIRYLNTASMLFGKSNSNVKICSYEYVMLINYVERKLLHKCDLIDNN